MNLTPEIKKKIHRIVSVYETSSLTPKYGALVILTDGPGRIKQITYGAHQTTEYGNLKLLIKMYVDRRGQYCGYLKPYLSRIGREPLTNDKSFIHLLRTAAQDQTMQEVQDEFFEQHYYAPALKWAKDNGFVLPLSMAVIYDSFIHSGSIPAFLRDDFSQVPPVAGGDEKAWIVAYVNARDYWLENHTNKVLRNTDYRTDCWKEEIQKGNWQLSEPVTCKFNTKSSTGWITIK